MLGVTEQLVSILFVLLCALCIVSCVVHVSSCCITTSWLYLYMPLITASALFNVAVPTQADEDNQVTA